MEDTDFSIHSDNLKLLTAFLDTCIEAGIPGDTEWNKHYRGIDCIKYIHVRNKLVLHTHSSGIVTKYSLPQDWDKALEAVKEYYLNPKYTGKWKVGDTISKDILNCGREDLVFRRICLSDIGAHGFIDGDSISDIIEISGEWFATLEDRSRALIKLKNIPTEDELILDKAVKASGLKIGDKNLFHKLPCLNSEKCHIYFLHESYNEKYSIVGFELIEGTPYAKVPYLGISETDFFYFKLEDLVKRKKELELSITIGDYRAEKTTDGIKFGCKRFTISELMTIKSLLNRTNAYMKVDLQVNGTPITVEMVNKLIKMCS